MSNKIRYFYEFEDFRLDADAPSLWRGDQLVAISPKALQTLVLLVKKKGEVVSREDLLENVWKETFVEEGNINYTISLLRKTLGNKDLVQTVPRRGYRLVAAVKEAVEKNSDFSENEPSALTVPRAAAGMTISQQSPFAEKHQVASAGITTSKNRSIFYVSALSGILLLTIFAFAWKSGGSENDIRGKGEAAIVSNVVSPPNEQSLQAYKRGMMILDDRDVQNRTQKALDEFQRAVTLDPTSALAYTGLAEGLASKAVSLPNEKSIEVYAQAKIAVDKAFSLNSNLFEAYLIRGWVRRNGDWDWSGAEEDLRRAVEIDPNNARARYRRSQLLSALGRHSEALSEMNKAYELDSLSEMIQIGRVPVLEAAGEYEKGLQAAIEYLQSNRENPPALRSVATFQYHLGDYPAVIENSETALAKNPDKNSFAWLSLLAASYAKTGQAEKADEMLRRLEIQSQSDKKSLYSLAMNYAEMGRLDDAIAALEKCYEVHEHRMMWMNVEPRFVNLKNDRRFQMLLEKMRLN